MPTPKCPIKYREYIEKMSKSHMGQKPWNKVYIPKDVLVSLYINEKMSIRKIAKKININPCSVYGRFREYGIKKRSSSEEHKGQHSSLSTEFKKDSVPWNKNKKGIMPPTWNKGTKGLAKVNSGSFKKGIPIELHPRYIDGRSKNKVYCKDCGKEISSYQSTCCKKCSDFRNSGENSGAWKGGISFEPYLPSFNQQLKDRIRVRDNFVCQLCGIPELECKRRLSIHHVDYNKQNSNLNNLITLCCSCHAKTNFNRKYYIHYFQKERIFYE